MIYIRLKSFLSWWVNIIRFIVFLYNNRLRDNNVNEKKVAIVISSWFGTTVPLFSITIGLLIKLKYKTGITFIYDDLEFSNNKFNPAYQRYGLLIISKILAKSNNVVYLSSLKVNLDYSFQIVEYLARLNTIHDLKRDDVSADNPYYRLVKQQLTEIVAKVNALLATNNFDYIIVPGGVSSSSGVFTALGKKYNTRIVSYDAGGNTDSFLLSVDGIAAHLTDITKVYHILKHKPPHNNVNVEVADLIEARRSGSDSFRYQIGKERLELTANKVVFIPLNISWDSAALGKNIVFDSITEWLEQTITWILNTSRDCDIIVREHPMERLAIAKSSDNYKELLIKKFGINKRINFIESTSDYNSYYLMESSDIVIPHTSTVGIEAAVLGKVVVMCSSAYYSSFDFVHSASSKEEYFGLITKAISGEINSVKNNIVKAKLAYYLTQKLNWVQMKFNPGRNLNYWQRKSLNQLIKDQSTALVLESIHENKPISLLQYEKLID